MQLTSLDLYVGLLRKIHTLKMSNIYGLGQKKLRGRCILHDV